MRARRGSAAERTHQQELQVALRQMRRAAVDDAAERRALKAELARLRVRVTDRVYAASVPVLNVARWRTFH